MYYTRIVLAFAIMIAVFILPGAVVKTQPNVPTINVDTLCDLSKTVQGEASGAFFLPDGNIIVIKGDTPYIIDSKSGEILRTLDKSPIETALYPELSKDGTKLLATVMGPKLAVWDVPTGKITYPIEKDIHYFCISPDGTKLYVTLPNKAEHPGLIAIYDMINFQEIETLTYYGLQSAYSIDISPDGQTLAVSVEKKPYGSSDTQTNQVILINLNDKENYTVVEPAGAGFLTMQFSPDGRRIASLYNDGNHTCIYIYNLETKEKKYIKREELSTLFGFDVFGIGNPSFINEKVIMTAISNLSGSIRYCFTWNILENGVKNYIEFNTNRTIDFKDSLILLCNQRGVIGYLNKTIVPVKDLSLPNENYLSYNNNQLEFYSDKSFQGSTQVFDLTGKMVAYLGAQAFVMGKNIIQINQPLAIGVYIFTIKSGTEQNSYKFIVE
ncbi:MAG: T9SS type A sorting domain-containing protein [bacterium]